MQDFANILELLPHVRRTARLLVANPERADQCAAVALEALTADGWQFQDATATKLQLFSQLIRAWESLYRGACPHYSRDGLKVALQRILPGDRLLLSLTSSELLDAELVCRLLEFDCRVLQRRQQAALENLHKAMSGCVICCAKSSGTEQERLTEALSFCTPALIHVSEPDELHEVTRLHLPNLFAMHHQIHAQAHWSEALRCTSAWWPAPVVSL